MTPLPHNIAEHASALKAEAIASSGWLAIRDGDPMGYALFRRHYTFMDYKDNRRKLRKNLFVGPGEKMVLITADGKALFVWRKFRSKDEQRGVNCAVFRNEGAGLSSILIREAEELAWARWPGERLFTYVNGAKVKSKNPGYCFLSAGWRKCGRTAKKGLVILEKCP